MTIRDTLVKKNANKTASVDSPMWAYSPAFARA